VAFVFPMQAHYHGTVTWISGKKMNSKALDRRGGTLAARENVTPGNQEGASDSRMVHRETSSREGTYRHLCCTHASGQQQDQLCPSPPTTSLAQVMSDALGKLSKFR
jgi:hypothetical protein